MSERKRPNISGHGIDDALTNSIVLSAQAGSSVGENNFIPLLGNTQEGFEADAPEQVREDRAMAAMDILTAHVDSPPRDDPSMNDSEMLWYGYADGYADTPENIMGDPASAEPK